jgi:hypothetical protein
VDHDRRRRSLREEDIDLVLFLLTSLIYSCFTGMVFNMVRPGILNHLEEDDGGFEFGLGVGGISNWEKQMN